MEKILGEKAMTRGRNATRLAESHPFDFDERVEFQEEGHAYRVNGFLVPTSVSSVVKQGFADDFDAVAIVRKNLSKWRDDASSKYHPLVDGKTDEEAERAVIEMWGKGRDGGTALHKHAELWLNGEKPVEGVPAAEVDLLLRGWQMLLARGHQIVRTELSVFWPPRGPPKVAGQIDFLTRTSAGLCIVDLKRSSKNLTASARAFKYGIGALATVGDTPLMRYSLQLSLYAVMLGELTREKTGELLLLQVDPERGTVRVTECVDLRAQARVLLLGL